MASLEVIALDTATPQLRAPGPNDDYRFPRPVNFEKGYIPRVRSEATFASPLVWNSNNFDVYEIRALANNITFPADAGSPINGQKILFRIKDDGVQRTLNWTTGSARAFREVGVLLPTATTAGKLLYVGAIYNSTDARWDVIAAGQEL